MSLHATAWAKSLTTTPSGERITRSEKLLLLILSDYYNPAQQCAWPSMKTLAEHSLLTDRRCRSIIRSLEGKGVVKVQRVRLPNGDNAPNRYFFPALPAEGAVTPRAVDAAAEDMDAPDAEPVLDAAAVKARVHAWLDTALDAAPGDSLEVYRMAYDEVVPEAAAKYKDVKGVGAASLLNEVVFHAAQRYGLDLDQTSVRRLAGMRRDFGFPVVEHLPEACQRAGGDPLSYLLSIVKAGAES